MTGLFVRIVSAWFRIVHPYFSASIRNIRVYPRELLVLSFRSQKHEAR